MYCKHYTRRTMEKRPFCRLNKEWNPICNGCDKKEYKSYKRMKSDKPLKTYSKKRAKTERERYSIITDDLTKCIENKNHTGKVDKHEIFGGKNRGRSIKYGLVIPLCRMCHDNEEIIKKWQIIGRQAFIDKYSEDLFIKEFQTKKGIKKELGD